MSTPSFDFRLRKRIVRDNGSDFEDFVFECLGAPSGEPGFEKRLARGRDGAIDLADRIGDPGGIRVAECKFIGSGDPREAHTRWKEVYGNLRKNLPELRENTSTRLASPYRAWLDPERLVVAYWFCVTTKMSDAERNSLEATIIDDFRDLANGGIEELRTLASAPGAVRVLRWDWFHSQLELNPALAFSWFRGLPKGVDLFDFAAAEASTFRAFLTGGRLRYFSRDDYSQQQGGKQLARNETSLISDLTGTAAPCLLISGPGGVGKTRLAFELAGALGDARHGFDVYRLGRSADFASLEDLVARYSKPASILLVVDYAEAMPNLADIAEAKGYLEEKSGHTIRLIATCRSSATNQVRDSLASLHPKQVSLASPLSGEDAYAQWVTRSILGLEQFPEPHELDRVCNGVPALAAFAVYLFRHHRAAFDNQFGTLLAIGDFDDWVQHRIALLIDQGSRRQAQERTLARIGLALPCPRNQLDQVCNDNLELLASLLTDRWIEEVEGICFAAHDVLADALVGRWLFEAEHAATDRAIDILCDAGGRDGLSQALISLERQAHDPRFEALSGAAITGALRKKFLEMADQWCGPLLDGRLLDFQEKLALLQDDELIRPMVEATAVLDIQLCRLAAKASFLGRHSKTSPQVKVLADLLELACQRPQFSNMVLRRAYALEPARFRDRALQDVRDFPTAEATHFMLAQLLRMGEPPDQVRQLVTTWLEGNGAVLRASYVYAAWLNAGGDVEAVSEAVLAWIDQHGALPEAEFVYAAWLDAGGGIEAVSEAVLAWIDQHGALLEANYVYAAWLNAGGGIEAVCEGVLAWIDPHGAQPEAQFVYAAWLNAGGGIKVVSEAVLAWIDQHGALPEAQFVYAAWLDAGGGIEAVSDAVLAWIDQHGALPEAQFVYTAWLNAGGGIEAVCEGVLAWIVKYGTIQEADFVYRSWLETGGDYDSIESGIILWVAQWAESHDFVFLSKALSKRSNLSEQLTLAIARWCAAFPLDEDVLFRLSRVLIPSQKSFTSAGALQIAECVNRVFASRTAFAEMDRVQFWSICVSLGSTMIYNLNPFGATRSIATIVRSGRIFAPGLNASALPAIHGTHGLVAQHVLYGLRQGELRTDSDREALKQFAAWLRYGCVEHGEAEVLLRRLDKDFPDEVWRIPSADSST